jgi:hypothetical protein
MIYVPYIVGVSLHIQYVLLYQEPETQNKRLIEGNENFQFLPNSWKFNESVSFWQNNHFYNIQFCRLNESAKRDIIIDGFVAPFVWSESSKGNWTSVLSKGEANILIAAIGRRVNTESE